MKTTCKLGEVNIFLPDASTSYFFITEDLTGLFKVETNIAAVKLLRKTARRRLKSDLYRCIDFDCESNASVIRTIDVESILQTAIIINELADVKLSETEINTARHKLSSHKKPRKQKWKAGDIFSIQLENDTYAFGQIVWKSGTHPVCGLFDINRDDIAPLHEIIDCPFISVLPVTSRSLDNHGWKVLGTMEVNIQVKDVPEKFNGENIAGARSFTDSILEKLGNAYYGIIPWNIFKKEDLFDQILLPTVERPSSARFLSSSEKNL